MSFRETFFSAQTTVVGPTDFFLPGVLGSSIRVHVMATNGEQAYYVLEGMFKASTEGITRIAQVQTVIYESNGQLNCEFDNNSLGLKITGIAATTIDWWAWVTSA